MPKEKDARQEIYDLVDQLNATGDGFDFNKDFVLKASLVLSDTTAIEFRVNSFNRDNMLRIESQWEGIARALLLTAQLLASWGYNRRTLVSNNAVIPLAYYIYRQGSPSGFVDSEKYREDRDKMRRWLITALLKHTFSGQPDNVLRPIRRIMQENQDGFPAAAIYDELGTTAKSMRFNAAEIDGLLHRYGKSYTFSVLALLYPWLKFDQHFHIDHIFPKAMFKERELEARGIPRDQWNRWLGHVNDFANLQLLQGLANQVKSDQEFEAWLQGQCPTPQHLDAYKQLHLIPDVDLAFENFPEFLETREQVLRERLVDLFGVQMDVAG